MVYSASRPLHLLGRASETSLHGVTHPQGRNVIYIALRMSHFIQGVKAYSNV